MQNIHDTQMAGEEKTSLGGGFERQFKNKVKKLGRKAKLPSETNFFQRNLTYLTSKEIDRTGRNER